MGVHWRKLCVVHPSSFFFSVAATKTKVRRLRLPGIEPGSNAWEASMITITLQALNTPGGDRTRDPRLTRPGLCLYATGVVVSVRAGTQGPLDCGENKKKKRGVH